MVQILALLFILPFVTCDDFKHNIFQLTYLNFLPALHPSIQPFGSGSCHRPLSYRDCPLFNYGSDLITPGILRTVFATWTDWVTIYTYEIKSDSKYGKTSFRFLSNGQNVYSRRSVSYNLSQKRCENVDATLVLTQDTCGRARLDSSTGAGAQSLLFYSQDPTTYLWVDICMGPGVEGSCLQRYFDLFVRADRVKNEKRVADLTGVPLDKVAADLARVMNKGMGEPEIKFSWVGQECLL